MTQYIDKSTLVAEIERRLWLLVPKMTFHQQRVELEKLLSFIDTIEVKEFQKKKLYVVTRCEEHSDYVEKVFFSEKKAEEYCKQFEGNEDAYGRDITIIEVDCPFEVKEADLKEEYRNFVIDDPVYSKLVNNIVGKAIAKHFFELGIKAAQKGE